jgi:hypothetical protein
MSRADDRSHWLGTAIEVRSRISRVALLLLTRTTKLKSFFRNVPSRFQAPNRLLAQPINNEGSLVEPILGIRRRQSCGPLDSSFIIVCLRLQYRSGEIAPAGS